MSGAGIIAKIDNYNLLGKGGACFPVAKKWRFVKKQPAKKKFVICNVAEGEPGVFKDGFLLKEYPEDVIKGVEIAIETLEATTAYIYLKEDYYKKYKRKLNRIIGKKPINLVKKIGGYIAGEETAVISAIEGARVEPKLKPPFPPEAGLWGYPTLVNNAETFYHIAKIADNEYKNTRFYSLSGDIVIPGVFELPEKWSCQKVLKETGNWPAFDFFVQMGGGAVGEILLPSELKKPVSGSGSIQVFNKQKTDVWKLMKTWVNFLVAGNCDKCVPCREGGFRLKEMIESKKIDYEVLADLTMVLQKTSFCALGRELPTPFNSLISKVINAKR